MVKINMAVGNSIDFQVSKSVSDEGRQWPYLGLKKFFLTIGFSLILLMLRKATSLSTPDSSIWAWWHLNTCKESVQQWNYQWLLYKKNNDIRDRFIEWPPFQGKQQPPWWRSQNHFSCLRTWERVKKYMGYLLIEQPIRFTIFVLC